MPEAYGCANQTGEDDRDVGRMTALLSGDCDLLIAGGVESMSRAPFVMPTAENAFSRSNAIYDTTIGWRFVTPRLMRPSVLIPCRRRPTMSRRSSASAAPTKDAGLFADELVPVRVPQGKGDPILVYRDEHPRPGTQVDQLARLNGVKGP